MDLLSSLAQKFAISSKTQHSGVERSHSLRSLHSSENYKIFPTGFDEVYTKSGRCCFSSLSYIPTLPSQQRLLSFSPRIVSPKCFARERVCIICKHAMHLYIKYAQTMSFAPPGANVSIVLSPRWP